MQTTSRSHREWLRKYIIVPSRRGINNTVRTDGDIWIAGDIRHNHSRRSFGSGFNPNFNNYERHSDFYYDPHKTKNNTFYNDWSNPHAFDFNASKKEPLDSPKMTDEERNQHNWDEIRRVSDVYERTGEMQEPNFIKDDSIDEYRRGYQDGQSSKQKEIDDIKRMEQIREFQREKEKRNEALERMFKDIHKKPGY